MKLKFTPKSLFLALAVVGISEQSLAQCTLANAVSDITLQCSGSGNTRTGVAYYPTKNMYYSVVAGTTTYSIETFGAAGGAALSSSVQVGDYRGLWYNSQLDNIEGNTFNSVGIFKHNIDPVTGYAVGTATNLLLGNMPNGQSCGAYDPTTNQVLYYDGGTLYKYSRSTGLQVTNVAITGLPAGNISLYSLGYTGVSGREVCLYDYTNQAVRFINYTSGAYVASCQLPASAPVPGSYRMGYTNNRIFLYDQALQRWYGYKVTDQPDIVFTGTNIACSGNTLNLIASGAAAYMWSTGAITTSVSVALTTNTMYAVAATSSAGCTSASNFFLTVNPSPTVTAMASNTLICGSGSSTITASGASSYTWSNGPTTASNVVAPVANTTTYTVLGVTNGCASSATVVIVMDAEPVVTASATKTMICLGESATLTASGASSYTWSEGPTMTTVLVSTPSVSSVYTVTGASVFGCTGSSNIFTVSVAVVPVPTVIANTNKSVICLGEGVILSGSGAGNYTWTPGNAVASGSLLVTPTVTTLYQVTGEDSNGCRNSNSVSISVYLCTGLDKNRADPALNVFPNPNNGSFVIKGNTTLDLNIVNHLGQLVKTIRLDESTGHECHVSDLVDGLYFIMPTGSTGKQKIIVQH